MATPYCVIFVTTPPGLKAKQIASRLIKSRCAACVNVVPRVESTYWWKGKMEVAKEALLVIKTKKSLVKKLMKLVQSVHPYTVPEIIALPIIKGHKPYLDWVKAETLK